MARTLQTHVRKLLRAWGMRSEPQWVEVLDQAATSGREQKIPRVVYQTAETPIVHPMHYKAIEEFRALNTDLSFEFFGKEKRDSYMADQWGHHPVFDVYKRAVFGQMRADIFRYCIVWDRGGYYFDFNKGCSVSLTSLHPAEAEGLVSYESNPEVIFPSVDTASTLLNPFNLVMQWAFGFAPRHEVLNLAINRIVDIEPFFRGQVFPQPKVALLTMSATGLFTSVFREWVGHRGIGTICEAGVDFNGNGVFRLRGSRIEMKRNQHYSTLKDREIVYGEPLDN